MAEGQQLFDRSVRYHVFLQRFNAGMLNRINDILTEADDEMVDRLVMQLGRLSDADLQRFAAGKTLTTQRGKAFMEFLRKQRLELGVRLRQEILNETEEVARLKINRQARDVASIGLRLGTPSPSTVFQALKNEPIRGSLLDEWTEDWSRARFRRVQGSLRSTFIEGKSVRDAAAALIGTKEQGFKDGILDVSRRSAETIVRTSFTHLTSQADLAIARENEDLIDWAVWTAVLDTRTSDICRSNDGKRFRADDPEVNTAIPAHPNCRSFWTWDFAGLEAPERDTYYVWLKKQPRDLIEEALGKKRALLFTKGGLTGKQLVKDATTGQPWTLDELRRRESEAFDKIAA